MRAIYILMLTKILLATQTTIMPGDTHTLQRFIVLYHATTTLLNFCIVTYVNGRGRTTDITETA